MNNNVRPRQFILGRYKKTAHIIWLNHIKPVHSHRCFAQDAYARASVTITLRGFTGHKAAASPPGPAFDMLKPGYESRRMGITSHVKWFCTPTISFTRHVKWFCTPTIPFTRHVKWFCTPTISFYTPCKMVLYPYNFILHAM